MPTEQLAGGLNSSKIAFGYFPASVNGMPLELLLYVRDKIFGLVDAHAAEILARTRSRMAAKSVFVSGGNRLGCGRKQPCFELRREVKGFLPLLAERAEDVVD